MMPDDLDLMQLASTGQKLARIDDTDYLAVHVVLAWPSGGVPAVYCAYADWATTPIARLAAKEAEIAELAAGLERYAAEATDQARRAESAEARLKELEQQIANQAASLIDLSAKLAAKDAQAPETPAQNQGRMLHAQHAALDPEPIICPDCDESGWKSARALQMHRQRAHQGMQTPQQSKQFVEDLGWRCAAKGCPGAHARDLHDSAFCTLHASRRQLTNGHEVPA